MACIPLVIHSNMIHCITRNHTDAQWAALDICHDVTAVNVKLT